MMRKWMLLALAMAAIPDPGISSNGNSDAAFGVLFPNASCPQAAYALTPCPCDPPQISYYVYSTKLDLSRYAGQFVSLRGEIEAGNCGVNLFRAGKATIVPPISCPCPASSQKVPSGAPDLATTGMCVAGVP